MTPYNDQLYDPPGPVALLTVRTLDGRDEAVAGVPALLDTGADVTLVPRWAVELLGVTSIVDGAVQLAGFDGTVRPIETAELEVTFQGGRFRGQYALIDQPHGIVGRNLLNHFRLHFDGPARSWHRVAAG